jgi:hypothetical protein
MRWIAGSLVLTVAVFAAGCSNQRSLESGYADQSKTQIQFFSPPGAKVEIKDRRSHQIAHYGAFDHRLEHTPEEFSVFNLSPGRYEFKYSTADGLPGVSVYGELNVYFANSQEARILQRRSFIPISLPSEYYQEVEITGDRIFPYLGESYRYAINQHDLERLKLGDVVEKVIFVANLEEAEEELAETKKEIAVYEHKIEYANKRFQVEYRDYLTEVGDPVANFLGTDRDHIGWEEERQEYMHHLAELEDKLDRLQALLDGDHVLARKGMLVLASQEVVEPHTDVVEAAEELGEVMLVMRIGGRHMHWGDPRQEMKSYKP